VLAISVDPPEESSRVVYEDSLPFAILSDADRQVTARYGLLHAGGGPTGDVPVPTQLLVRSDGAIAWRHVASSITDRAYPSETLAAVEALE
jgi:peroxiredoxin